MFDNQTITLVISFKTGFFYLSYIGNYPRKILRTQTQKKTKGRNFIKTKDSEGKKNSLIIIPVHVDVTAREQAALAERASP